MKQRPFYRLGVAALFALILLMPLSGANATWVTLLYDDFTNPWGSWPWSIWGHPWTVLPTSGYRWGIAPNISHYGFPEPVQSIWCAGLNGSQISDLEPFVDPYPANLNTKAIWGPFNLSSAAAAECSFWYWNDTQQINDYLLWGASLTASAATIYEGGRNYGPNPTFNWASAVIDFDSLTTSTGSQISLIGQSTVYVVFFFHSDASIQTTWGGFIDEVALGYDDGMFDLFTVDYYFLNPADSTEAVDIMEGAPYLLRFDWSCAGIGETGEFTIECEIDEEVWYSERFTASGDESYATYADSLWSTLVLGNHDIMWRLDVDDEVAETYENNNNIGAPFTVVQFDSMPMIEILRPTFGDTADAGFWIKWDAYDRESDAQIHLFYDVDSLYYNGMIIQTGTPIYEDSSPDSFYWNTSSLLDGAEYYIFARIMDGINAPVYDYSSAPLVIDHIVGVEPWGGTPLDFALLPNFPNPFNASTGITYSTPEKSQVDLAVFDISGRLVKQLYSGETTAGVHNLVWNTESASGVYFCRLKMQGLQSGKTFTASQKMLLLR